MGATSQVAVSTGVVARLRAWPPLAVLVGWTVFLWGSRLRNVLGNDELGDAGVAWRVAVVVVFVALAALVAVDAGPWAIPLLVWWTVGFWLVATRTALAALPRETS